MASKSAQSFFPFSVFFFFSLTRVCDTILAVPHSVSPRLVSPLYFYTDLLYCTV
jgi:hypothetical protein